MLRRRRKFKMMIIKENKNVVVACINFLNELNLNKSKESIQS